MFLYYRSESTKIVINGESSCYLYRLPDSVYLLCEVCLTSRCFHRRRTYAKTGSRGYATKAIAAMNKDLYGAKMFF